MQDRVLCNQPQIPEHDEGRGLLSPALSHAATPFGQFIAATGCERVPRSAGLFGVFEARNRAPRPSLVYCGDDGEAKDVAAALIRDVGFDPVDAGALRVARYAEPLAPLVGQLAYEGDGGPELAYRFEQFGT
jgi:hypothetical protein